MDSNTTSIPSGECKNIFTVTRPAVDALGPRLGRISLPGREIIETPHYLGNTSRGAVSHITQDNFKRHTAIKGVYVGLEDFIELKHKNPPPLYHFQPADGASALRIFTALPDETLLVLGARRVPPIAAPASNPNTNETVSVFTSVGFRQLNAAEYVAAVEKLRPDIVLGLGDIPYERTLGSKRIEKATDRSIQWLQDHISLRKKSQEGPKAQLFASMLPVSCAKQQYYVDCLTDEISNEIAGLGILGSETLEDLPETLQHLVRLALTAPQSPFEVLRQIHLGLDVHVIPFIGSATDAGTALDFTFPVPRDSKSTDAECNSPRPLGTDMWTTSHATDLSPLSRSCQCYTCRKHHRTYIHHLLSAKEMLGWVLLQIHNHHTIDLFFAGVRQSIAKMTFEQDMCDFERTYQSQLPGRTGKGPRVRGYEFKTEGPGESKKNAAAFTTLDEDKERLTEANPPPVDMDADVLQHQGFGEKQ